MDYSRSLLLTDLYQINMVESYLKEGMEETAVFEFFVRKLPRSRGFLMAAGLEQVLGFLAQARCSDDEIAWARESGKFSERVIDYLASFSFTGDVDALAEGTVFFPDEPVIRVSAALPQAQLIETRLINFLQFQTLVTTKAARMRLAAGGRDLIDFGLRRAHSGEAGLMAARAAYVAGFSGTATVPAARLFDIPIYGTMAHSFVQVHEDEKSAFLNFATAKPDQTVFLIDTYDTEAAAQKVTELAPVLAELGISIRGVRLDSGDLGEHARQVRAILDEAGLQSVRIIASGGIDEYQVNGLTDAEAPIDAYGVGTSLVVSSDAPALDCAYKLKAYAGTPRRKRSEGKAYWPGSTQVFRQYDARGKMTGDVIGSANETIPGEPLLQPVLRSGRFVGEAKSLRAIRQHAASQLDKLPDEVKKLEQPLSYPVSVSAALQDLACEFDRSVSG